MLLLFLHSLSPELSYEKSSGLAFQYLPIFPAFGPRSSRVSFHFMVYKGISWSLIKEHGDGVKSIELASQFSYLLTLWCWTSHSSLLSIGFLIYRVGIIMGTPALLTSHGLLQGWAGQWGPTNHQRLSLHLGYLVFHNFSAHSSLVRRLVRWRFPCLKDQGTENVFYLRCPNLQLVLHCMWGIIVASNQIKSKIHL